MRYALFILFRPGSDGRVCRLSRETAKVSVLVLTSLMRIESLIDADNRQVQPSALPPERLPIRHRLFVDSRRGEGLEAGDYDQAGTPRSLLDLRR